MIVIPHNLRPEMVRAGGRQLPRRRRRVRAAVVVVAVCVVAVLALLGGLYLTLPGVGDAEHRVEVRLRANEGHDTGLPAPTRIAKAIVVIEDRRFYGHGALDVRAMLRALWTRTTGAGDPGGSTITQQLAKNLYGRRARGSDGKLAQVGVAFKLESRYSKARILELYLNSIYYGNGYWGIDAASRGYFGKPPSQLDWGEASMLAGLPQAPSAYDPARHFQRARKRQREVLAGLVSNRVISARTAARAWSETARWPEQVR